MINNAWYERTWLVIFLCFIFFPVGLYGIWKNSHISKGWKIGSTALIGIILIASLGFNNDNQDIGTIGKYKMEPLPNNFSYNIIEDKSNNEKIGKNQLTVEINKKITVEQIATLADKLFSSKPKQRRFYIFYQLPGWKTNSGAWATSHFDSDLEIQILGSTAQQDSNSKKIIDAFIDGDIIGKWREEQYSNSSYIIYKKDNKTFIKIFFKDLGAIDKELKGKKIKNGVRYDYIDGNILGEYLILNLDGGLEFYNNDNKRFTALKIKL